MKKITKAERQLIYDRFVYIPRPAWMSYQRWKEIADQLKEEAK